MWGGHTWRARVARAYNGGLGALRGPGQSPWSGVRGAKAPLKLVRGAKAPLKLVRGRKPPEAENLLAFGCPTEAANLLHSPYFAKSLTPGICDTSDKN